MSTTNTWSQVVQKITGVENKGAFSKTYTPSTSKQTANGSAGYYSSIPTTCNAVSLSGNASTSHVLNGKTFYTTSLSKKTGTMANRGALNWNPSSSTSYTVSAGYYSGGTLNSANAYNAGVAAGKTSFGSWSVAFCQSTYGINGSIGSTIIGTRTLGQNGYVCAISLLDQTSESEGGVSISGGSSVLNYRTSYGNSWVRILANRVNSSTSFNVTNSYTGGARSLAIIVIYVKA